MLISLAIHTTLIDLHSIAKNLMKTLLHVGCGRNDKKLAGPGFQGDDWQEIRFDINPEVHPDIIGSMTDISAVTAQSVDAVYSSHNIEHLYPHEVKTALCEFKRVLRPHGFALITCPDLQTVAQLVADDRLNEPAYQSPAGPISPIDMLYGLRTSLANGNLYMAHRCGFTQRTLGETIRNNGFEQVVVGRYEQSYALWALALKTECSEQQLTAMVNLYFPPK